MTAALVYDVTRRPMRLDGPRPASGTGLANSRHWLNTHNGAGEAVAPQGHDPRTPAPGAIGATHTPGQLWERVRETPTGARAQLTANQDNGIVRAYDAAHTYPGPAICLVRYGDRHVCPRSASHGIIRAGERIK